LTGHKVLTKVTDVNRIFTGHAQNFLIRSALDAMLMAPLCMHSKFKSAVAKTNRGIDGKYRRISAVRTLLQRGINPLRIAHLWPE
jgi:hypothetical protein